MNLHRALDPVGAAVKDALERDAKDKLIAAKSAAQIEREVDLWAMFRMGLCFQLSPEEVEEALLWAMHRKRIKGTEANAEKQKSAGITT